MTPLPKGEALPPLEDFVRKMSNEFSDKLAIAPGRPVEDEGDEDGDGE